MCQLTNPIPLFLHQSNVQRIVNNLRLSLFYLLVRLCRPSWNIAHGLVLQQNNVTIKLSFVTYGSFRLQWKLLERIRSDVLQLRFAFGECGINIREEIVN